MLTTAARRAASLYCVPRSLLHRICADVASNHTARTIAAKNHGVVQTIGKDIHRSLITRFISTTLGSCSRSRHRDTYFSSDFPVGSKRQRSVSIDQSRQSRGSNGQIMSKNVLRKSSICPSTLDSYVRPAYGRVWSDANSTSHRSARAKFSPAFHQTVESDVNSENNKRLWCSPCQKRPENCTTRRRLQSEPEELKGFLEEKSISQERKSRKNKKRGEDILKYGAPTSISPTVFYHRNYVVCYDGPAKIPLWVAEHLTKYHLKGPAARRRCRFNKNKRISPRFRSDLSDYSGSDWSRGHLAAAANHKHDQRCMQDTFLLTNIVLQDATMNVGVWNALERYSRSLTANYEDVRVISGTLRMEGQAGGGGGVRKFVKYELVGKSRVAVPTHLFKVILAEQARSKQSLLLAFVVPNFSTHPHADQEEEEQRGSGTKGIDRYRSSLEFIEEKTGLVFFPKLDRSTISNGVNSSLGPAHDS